MDLTGVSKEWRKDKLTQTHGYRGIAGIGWTRLFGGETLAPPEAQNVYYIEMNREEGYCIQVNKVSGYDLQIDKEMGLMVQLDQEGRL